MPTNHRNQVMPDLSPEEYAALKADIDAHGVRIPIEVDEEGDIIDGFNRKQICDELGIECPERVLTGLTDAQKREHAYRMNLMRRQLTRKQKREIARTLREEGWTQERIAQVLGVSQSTIGNWLQQFTNSGKLRQPTNVRSKDGKKHKPKKSRRRTTHPTEQAIGPETSQLPSDAGDGPAQAPEHQETPQPRDTPAEAQAPGSEPGVASDVPDAPQTPPLISDELQMEARQRASLPLGSSPGQSAEADAEGWVNALQDLFATLETLQAQGRLLPPSTDWTLDTRALGLATIRRIQGICSDMAGVVEADMSETAARNGHAVSLTPSPFLPPIADAVQAQENGELVTVSSAEASVGEVSDGDQLPSQGGGEVKPPHEPVVPVQEEAKPSPPELPQAPTRPAGSRTRRSKQAAENGLGSGAPEQTAQDHTTLDDAESTKEPATMGHPAPQHDEEAIDPAAEVERPSGVPAPSDTADSVSIDVTRCDWCGGTQFLPTPGESGRIYCECGSVYNPSTGHWAPGRQDRRQSPPASLPATAAS